MTTNKSVSDLDIFDFVEPCEPDCTPERHAYHQGQWDMAGRVNKHFGLPPHPTESFANRLLIEELEDLQKSFKDDKGYKGYMVKQVIKGRQDDRR